MNIDIIIPHINILYHHNYCMILSIASSLGNNKTEALRPNLLLVIWKSLKWFILIHLKIVSSLLISRMTNIWPPK